MWLISQQQNFLNILIISEHLNLYILKQWLTFKSFPFCDRKGLEDKWLLSTSDIMEYISYYGSARIRYLTQHYYYVYFTVNKKKLTQGLSLKQMCPVMSNYTVWLLSIWSFNLPWLLKHEKQSGSDAFFLRWNKECFINAVIHIHFTFIVINFFLNFIQMTFNFNYIFHLMTTITLLIFSYSSYVSLKYKPFVG